MTLTAWHLGELVRVSGAFRDLAGTLLNPTTVRLKVRTPAGVTTTYTYGTDVDLVRDSTGNFHFDVNANAVGKWHYRWESSGTGQAAEPGEFVVQSSLVD